MYLKILNLARKLRFSSSDYPTKNQGLIKLFWWRENHNFGDVLNYELVKRTSSREVERVPFNYSGEHIMAIGSILQNANANTIVWGSGLIDSKLEPYRKPREVLAVRGPLTRRRLLDLKIRCPDIYGDPALIMPELFYPVCERQFDLGIIPHYVDKNHAFFKQHFAENVKIIDVEQQTCEGFILDVMSCKRIVSSSLHGLIIGDAYDVPALRISFSNEIFGGDFKFDDYYLSVGREVVPALKVNEKTSVSDIFALNFNYSKKVDVSKLMEVNPF